MWFLITIYNNNNFMKIQLSFMILRKIGTCTCAYLMHMRKHNFAVTRNSIFEKMVIFLNNSSSATFFRFSCKITLLDASPLFLFCVTHIHTHTYTHTYIYIYIVYCIVNMSIRGKVGQFSSIKRIITHFWYYNWGRSSGDIEV